MHPEYVKYDPFRSPQWRSERVLEMIEAENGPLRPRRFDDSYVRTYRQFLIRWRNTEEDEEKTFLFPQAPSLYYAQHWHYHPDPEWRTLLQARILTRASDQDIAEAFGTLPDSVFWYETIFFNVRDRLNCHDWIVKSILGTALTRSTHRDGSLTDQQRDLVYKLFGYFGGPLVLNVMISGFDAASFPKKSSEIANWFDNSLKMLLRSRAAAAARIFEINRYNVMQLFELSLGVMNHDFAAKGAAGGAQNELQQNIEALMQEIEWGLAYDEESLEQINSQQQAYVRSAVEPRASEQLQLAAGETPALLTYDAARQTRTLELDPDEIVEITED